MKKGEKLPKEGQKENSHDGRLKPNDFNSHMKCKLSNHLN
jgi:hypothetical protein